MSPSCFVCSLKPYSPVGLCCVTFFFFSFFTEFQVSSEERGVCWEEMHNAYLNTPKISAGKNLKAKSPHLVAWLTQPYLYLVSYIVIIGYLIPQ